MFLMEETTFVIKFWLRRQLFVFFPSYFSYSLKQGCLTVWHFSWNFPPQSTEFKLILMRVGGQQYIPFSTENKEVWVCECVSVWMCECVTTVFILIILIIDNHSRYLNDLTLQTAVQICLVQLQCLILYLSHMTDSLWSAISTHFLSERSSNVLWLSSDKSSVIIQVHKQSCNQNCDDHS